MKVYFFHVLFLGSIFYSFGQGITGVVVIDNNSAVTNHPEKKVSLAIEAKGAIEMMLSNNGSFTGSKWEKYETRKPYWKLHGEDGIKTIYAKFRDGDGNVSETVTATIELDRTPPLDADLIVNGGKGFTNDKSRTVMLETHAQEADKMRVSNRNDFLGAPWVPYRREIKAWKLDFAEGKKSIYVQYMDKAGNITPVISADIVLDLTPPRNCSVKIENDAPFVKSNIVKLNIKAEGASEMIIRGGEWMPFQETIEWELPQGDGKREIFVKFRDEVGNQSEVVQDDVIIDTKPPENGLVLINNGSKYAQKHNEIQLKIQATGASEMMVSNDSTFRNAKWQSFNPLISAWSVDDNDGEKWVYVKFRDQAGNESRVFSDDVILDKTPPSKPFIRIQAPNSVYDSINKYTIISDEAKVVNLQLHAEDADYMMISNSSNFYAAKWEKFRPKYENWELSGTEDGERAVFVRYRDVAGNISETASDRAKVDTEPPLDTKIMIDNNAEYATDPEMNVSLQLFARGADFMMVSNDPTFEGAVWEPYQRNKNWKLQGDEGIKTVLVKFKDFAGNTSPPAVDDIILDRTPPTEGSIILDKGQKITNHPDKVVLVKVKAKDAELMQISNTQDFKGARWQAYSNLNFNWSLVGDDGLKYVFARFKDKAGNVSEIYADTIQLDRTPPKEGTVTINEGNNITNNANKKVKLKLHAVDVSEMRLSNRMDFKESDGTTDVTWIPYSTEADWTLTGPDGLKTVYVQFKDKIGNVSKTAYARIGIDRSAPKEGRISINNGSKYCTDVSGYVTLQLYAKEATHMMVSNKQNFSGGEWRKYEYIYPNWLLDTETDGEKKVYVKFKDEAGNETSPIAATVILDRQEPVGEEVVINNGAEYTNEKSNAVELELKAEGATEMFVSNTPFFRTGKWEPYNTKKRWTVTAGDGAKVVYVKFRDEAGNESAVASSKIIFDTEAPIPQYVKINGDKTLTDNTRVQLTIKARGADMMMVSNSPRFESAIWEPYTATKDWDLLEGEGLKRVFVKFKDQAQNESSHIYGDITLANKF